jgi:glucose/arabinose dehydrogenase
VNALPSGTNSGWQTIMRPDPVPSLTGDLFDIPGAGSTYSDPEFSWLDTIAPTALLFPVGSSLGMAFDDVALVGDFTLGQIYAFPLNGARDAFDVSGFTGVADLVASNDAERDQFLFGSGFGSSFGGVTDLKLGPDGALYVVSIGNPGLSNGAVFRVDGPAPVPALGQLGLPLLVLALLAAALRGTRSLRRNLLIS